MNTSSPLGSLEDFVISPAELEKQVDEWVQQPEIGLRFDPFRERDAGADPKLPLYLVDSGAFDSLWGDWPSFVFAPAGGGKTAFRVRLTHACRAGEDRRRVFPIVLPTLDPAVPPFESLMQAAASELLLHLIYFPSRFSSPDEHVQRSVRRALDESLVDSLEHRLDQIQELLGRIQKEGDWDLLADNFDPAAGGLFSPPAISEVESIIATLRSLPSRLSNRRADAQIRFDRFQTLLSSLDYEATHLLVDGVDAYLQTQRDPAAAMKALQPFLERTPEWSKRRIYAKYFLPLELRDPLACKGSSVLTDDVHFDTIGWTPDRLREVIGQRLRAAAGEYRAITSLDALCTPALRGLEDELLQIIHRPLPREVLMLVEQVFIEHIRSAGPHGRLEPEDLDAAIRWYRRLEMTDSS